MRYKAFDTAQAEQSGEPITISLNGIDIVLPPKIPAIVGIEVLRLQNSADSTSIIPLEIIDRIGKALFGKDKFNALLATGIDVDKLGEIIQWTIKEYQGLNEPETQDDDQGNSPAPQIQGE